MSLVAFAFLLAAPLATLSTPQEEATPKASIGDVVPDFRFAEFLTGGDGRLALSEFRGQPVLLVNWTDTDFGRGSADEARKIAEDLAPDGLVVVLRDTHNRTADEILVSAMRRYPGSPARFVRNRGFPIEYEDNGPPPDIALIDIEGRLLVAGSYTSDMGTAEKLAKAELKTRKRGWGEHGSAKKARALLYGKGRIADALDTCEDALGEEPEHADLLAVRDEIELAFAYRERAVTFHMEQGEYVRAAALAEELAESASGRAELEERTAALSAALATDRARAELELDEELTSLLKPLTKKAPRASDAKKLERFAEEAGDTRVGRRAKELARIAALAVD